MAEQAKQKATQLLVWGVLSHMVTDWLLQNDWMAVNKKDIRHPAAWVHSGIYAIGMSFVFKWPAALLLGLFHLIIDSGKPLQWWFGRFKRLEDGPMTIPVALWTDQALHASLIAVMALLSE